MGRCAKIAEAIFARGADCLLVLKNNQRSLAEEVALFFDTPGQRATAPFVTTDADHGRIETRRHWVSHDVGWLNGDRRVSDEPRFPGLKAIAMVEACVERTTPTTTPITTARRFLRASLALDAALIAGAARACWGTQNRLHWVLDVPLWKTLPRRLFPRRSTMT